MPGESPEVRMARMDERLSMILDEVRATKESRKEQYQAQEAFRLALNELTTRVSGVEKSLTEAQPTIREFVDVKAKIQGAGKLGHWLWVIGAFLIGAVFKGREAILHWFMGGAPSAH